MLQSEALFKTNTHYSSYRKRDSKERAELGTPQLGEARSFDREILIEINRKNAPYRLFLCNFYKTRRIAHGA